MTLKDHPDPFRRRLGWKWTNGTGALTQLDFGDPTSVTSYRVCVYDHSAGAPRLAIAAAIAAAESCGTRPCWKALSDRGWSYLNPVANAGGIAKILLKSGTAGQPSVRVTGRGGSLALGAPWGAEFFDQDPSVVVQIHRSDTGRCWSSTFDASSTKRNDGQRFKARTP